jgi:hypothetical protein
MPEGTRVKPELAVTAGQWDYVCCHCIVEMGSPLTGTILTYECVACGVTSLRFIHTLEHMKNRRQIQVGVRCAGILMESYKIPRLAENETKRKESWRIHYRTPGRCSTTIDDLIQRGKL